VIARALAGRPLGAVLVVAYVAVLASVAGNAGVLDRIERGFTEPQANNARPDEPKRPRLRPPQIVGADRPIARLPKQRKPRVRDPSGAVKDAARDTASGAWRAVRLPLLVIALVACTSVLSRWRARAARLARQARYELRLGREDIASPYEREKLFDALCGQLSVRWWERIALGQPSIALELHSLPDKTQRLTVAAAPRELRAAEARLANTYPDVRLIPLDVVPNWCRRVVRLKKRRPFVERLQTIKDDEHATIESLLTTMAELDELATVQLVLTPAPRIVYRLARRLLKLKERTLVERERRDRSDIGPDSVLEDKELKGALETQHRSLYLYDLRVCAGSLQTARALAGVFAEARAENELAERNMIVRRNLYAARVAQAAPNPLPSPLHGVLSASELAALWSLPRQRTKLARLVRSPVRRAPAPPEISRDPADAIMRDERGRVGIRAADRKYGLALIGGQGVGKTAVMARTIELDAADRDAALIVFDPKQDLARHALGLIPKDRTCWYMDFAEPEVGINPLRVDGAQPGVVADMVLSAFRDAFPEGSIMQSADRFLRNAAMAVCAVEERPSFWHMHELLEPRQSDYRDRVVALLQQRPDQAALAMYWGRTFPEMWMDATRGQLAMALDSPRNKIERLCTTPGLDKLLRHPFSVDVGEIIRRREVLIVNGALGQVGEQNAALVLQLILQLVHQALMQMQRLPREERVRVCLKIDEAHMVLTPSFATMLALHRSAGPLEVTAAWQYTAQVRDAMIRSGLKSLLRSRVMFAMSEADDAREQAEIALEVYADLFRGEQEDRQRARVSPDDLIRLPNYHAIATLIADGQRASSFDAQTDPTEGREDPQLADRHLDRQRQAGAHCPGPMLPPDEIAPVPDYTPVLNERNTGPPASRDNPSESDTDTANEPEREEPAAEPQDREPEKAERDEEPDELPATYAAVHKKVLHLIWDGPPRKPDVAGPDRDERAAAILADLWQHKAMLTGQIAHKHFPDADSSGARRLLTRMYDAGWVDRSRFSLPRGEGRSQYAYWLAKGGFAIARDRGIVPPESKFRAERPSDHRLVTQPLQVIAWVLCYRDLLGDRLADWIGEPHGTIEVPRKPSRGRGQLEPPDVALEGYAQLRDLKPKRLGRIVPDATLYLDFPEKERCFDVLVELDRSERPALNVDKLHRYDALISCWWRAVPRYQQLGEPPAALFICPDDARARALAERADRELAAALIARPGDAPESWRYPARERTMFASEPDIHHGNPRALMLPRLPGRNLALREVELPHTQPPN
jgi:hypothetical protein